MYGKRRSVYVILITYNKNSCYSKKKMVTKNICMTSSSYFFFLTEHATIFLSCIKNARLCIEIVEVVV